MITADTTFKHREQGKVWTLPVVLAFGTRTHKLEQSGVISHQANHCEYKVLGFRTPKAGEWFLSGAIVGAYEAPHDQRSPYLVVEPTVKKKLVTTSCYVEL